MRYPIAPHTPIVFHSLKQLSTYRLIATVNVSDELAQGQSDSGFKPFLSNALINASHAESDPRGEIIKAEI